MAVRVVFRIDWSRARWYVWLYGSGAKAAFPSASLARAACISAVRRPSSRASSSGSPISVASSSGGVSPSPPHPWSPGRQ